MPLMNRMAPMKRIPTASLPHMTMQALTVAAVRRFYPHP